MVEMVQVQSSNIAAIGWEAEVDEDSDVEGAVLDTGTLTVEFTNGSLYEYDEVPESTFEGLRDAESVGSYFHAHVRNAFTAVKVA